MKSWNKPTAELIDRALTATLDTEQRRYFFNNLQNPLWARPLWERGFFKNAPVLIPISEGGIQIPFWPESQYLVRIAKDASSDVVDIASKISTENPRVLEDMVDIAIAVDVPELTKKFFNHAVSFANSPFTRWHYQKLGKLFVHWAKLGLRRESVSLAHRVVSFHPPPLQTDKKDGISEERNDLYDFLNKPEPRPACDLHVYQEILEKDVIALVDYFPWQTVQLLVKSLSQAITWSQPEAARNGLYDASDFWCRDVKEPKAYGDDAKGILAHCITRTCELVLEKESSIFILLDQLLRKQRWYFFSRLRWYLYSRFPELAKNQIKKEALDSKEYEDGEYGYEFASMLLAASKNNFLENSELLNIFNQISKGPDIDKFKEWMGGLVDDEKIELRRGYFFTKQMFPFSPVLPRFPEFWQKYQKYIAKHGERRINDYFKVGEPVSFSAESKSPATANDLLAKSNDDLLAFLKTWQPDQTHTAGEPSDIFGLAGVFTEAFKQKPERFLELTDQLTLPAPYVRNFLYAITDMAKQKLALPWEKIISLSEWIIAIEQKQNANEQRQIVNQYSFSECKHVLAGLLKHGSFDYSSAIPFDLRPRVFAILKTLASEDDPRLSSKNAFGGDLMTQAINSVRAEAVHALVDHAFWIKRNLALQSGAMEAMPEVRRALEERLDPALESSLAVHALFGFLTPSLNYVDPNWLRSIRSRIFPAGEDRFECWAAAWTTYVSWNHPSKPAFELLEPEYWRAVSELPRIRISDNRSNRSVEALGEHLIMLYAWGLITLSPDRSLMTEFLKEATPSERAHVMNYAGRALESSQPLPQEIISRLIDYWDFRLRQAKSDRSPEAYAEELSDFTWWFRSGKFETSWSFRQIEEFLRIVPDFPETGFLLEELEKHASEYPEESAACLQLIVKKMTKDRYVYMDEKTVKFILRAAESSNNPAAIELANSVQDELLKLGRFEYRNLDSSA